MPVWQFLILLLFSSNIGQLNSSSVHHSRSKSFGMSSSSRSNLYRHSTTGISKYPALDPDTEDDTEDNLEGSGSGESDEVSSASVSYSDDDDHQTSGCSRCSNNGDVNAPKVPTNLSIEVNGVLRHGKCRKMLNLYWRAPIGVSLTLKAFDVIIRRSDSPENCIRLRLPNRHNYTNETLFTYQYRVPHGHRAEDFAVLIRSIPCSNINLVKFPIISSTEEDSEKCTSDSDKPSDPQEMTTAAKTGEAAMYSMSTEKSKHDKKSPTRETWKSVKAVDVILVASLVSVVVTIIVVVVIFVVVRKSKCCRYGLIGYDNVCSTSPHGSQQCIVQATSGGDANCGECHRILFKNTQVSPILFQAFGKSLIKKTRSNVVESL